MKSKLIINLPETVHFIDPMQIVFCQSDNSYTHVHLSCGERYFIAKSLAKLSQELSEINFVRVHQSYLINKDHIQVVDKSNKQIKLTNNHKIPFSGTVKALMVLLDQ